MSQIWLNEPNFDADKEKEMKKILSDNPYYLSPRKCNKS